MTAKVINLRKAEDNRDVVHRAVQCLSEGGLVVFPTETVYGIGASARSTKGVQRIYDAKGRRDDAPLALAIRGVEDALDYAPKMGKRAERLARRCWPGPMTLVANGNPNDGLLAHLPADVQQAVAPENFVGLRAPAHEMVQQILQLLVGPIALTSANRSGSPPASNAAEIIEQLGENVSLILDDGPCRYGQASTVVKVTDSEINCLREGVIPLSAIERLSSMLILIVCTGNTCRSPMAEGILRRLVAEKLQCTPEELEQRGVAIASAGIAAAPGAKATEEAVVVMRDRGDDISNHASRPLTEKLVQQADLVLTLAAGHRDAIARRWPAAASRMMTLRPDAGDVDDPIGGPLEVYRQCADQIEQALKSRVEGMSFS